MDNELEAKLISFRLVNYYYIEILPWTASKNFYPFSLACHLFHSCMCSISKLIMIFPIIHQHINQYAHGA